MEFLILLYLSYKNSNTIIPLLEYGNKYFVIAQNIKLLFEYLIPLVIEYFSVIKRNSWKELLYLYINLI